MLIEKQALLSDLKVFVADVNTVKFEPDYYLFFQV